MIGRTLFFYFFRRYVLILTQFFIGVMVIAYLVDFTEFSRRVGGLPNYTIGGGLMMSALKMPLILQTAMPFVILFSAMATLMTLNRKYELVIARSAGVSAWQFLAPMALASLLVGIVTITVLNPAAARALAYAEELETTFRGKAAESRDVQRLPWLSQKTEEGTTIIGAKKTARRGLLLSDATLIRLDPDGSIAERLDARQAVLEDGGWQLQDVTRYGRNGERETLKNATVKSGLEPEVVEERFARPEAIPMFELRRKIEAARAFGLSADAFSMRYHSLLALPALLVAMTLIAATVSMRFVRLGQSAPMILSGVLAGFLLYVVSVLVKAFGSAGFVPPPLAAWFPVLVAGLVGVTFLLHKEDG
jgi:lipopolysaccharide export system permease protein